MKINKFSMPFLLNEFDDVDGGGGGGGAVEVEDVNVDTDGNPDDGLEDINLDSPNISDSSLNPDAVADALAARMQNLIPHNTQNQSTNDRAPTAEERMAFLKQMGRPEVTEDMVVAMFGPGEPAIQQKRAQLLQQLLDQQTEHALKLAGMGLQHNVRQLRSTYDPLLKLREDEIATRFYSDVEKAYPSLKGHAKIIRMAANQMMQSGYRSQGGERDALNLAVETAKLIKQVNPQFTLKRAKSSGGRAGMPAMASSRSGAGGGGTNGGQPKQNLSRAQALYFGKK